MAKLYHKKALEFLEDFFAEWVDKTPSPFAIVSTAQSKKFVKRIQTLLGCRQAVRHLVLVQTFRGSNPCTPVNLKKLLNEELF
jgi:hypothetical protein